MNLWNVLFMSRHLMTFVVIAKWTVDSLLLLDDADIFYVIEMGSWDTENRDETFPFFFHNFNTLSSSHSKSATLHFISISHLITSDTFVGRQKNVRTRENQGRRESERTNGDNKSFTDIFQLRDTIRCFLIECCW